MTEVSIRLADRLPAPELTVIEDDGRRRTQFVNELDLLQMLRSALEERVSIGQHYFPPALLGGDLVHNSVWWQSPGTQVVTVENVDRDQHMLSVPLPGLVLRIGKTTLRLAAIKGQERPEPGSDLFLAPLPNIGTGSVCMGSGDKVKPEMVWDPSMAWAAIWSSAFTDHSISGQSHKYANDVRDLLFELDGQVAFPEDDLVPLETSLEEFMHESS